MPACASHTRMVISIQIPDTPCLMWTCKFAANSLQIRWSIRAICHQAAVMLHPVQAPLQLEVVRSPLRRVDDTPPIAVRALPWALARLASQRIEGCHAVVQCLMSKVVVTGAQVDIS